MTFVFQSERNGWLPFAGPPGWLIEFSFASPRSRLLASMNAAYVIETLVASTVQQCRISIHLFVTMA